MRCDHAPLPRNVKVDNLACVVLHLGVFFLGELAAAGLLVARYAEQIAQALLLSLFFSVWESRSSLLIYVNLMKQTAALSDERYFCAILQRIHAAKFNIQDALPSNVGIAS
eukprot:IDg11053t1